MRSEFETVLSSDLFILSKFVTSETISQLSIYLALNNRHLYNYDYLSPLNSLMASTIATIFGMGVFAWILWMVLQIYPPSLEKMSNL